MKQKTASRKHSSESRNKNFVSRNTEAETVHQPEEDKDDDTAESSPEEDKDDDTAESSPEEDKDDDTAESSPAPANLDFDSPGHNSLDVTTWKLYLKKQGDYTSNDVQVEEDILSEILCRVAVKGIGRFSAISKSWNRLICSTYFRHKQFRICQERLSQKKLLICYELGRRVKVMTGIDLCKPRREEARHLIVPGISTHQPKLIGTSWGITCILLNQDDGTEDVVLLNPTLNKYTLLPKIVGIDGKKLKGKNRLSYAFGGPKRNGHSLSLNDFRVAVLVVGFGITIFSTRIWEWVNLDYSPLSREGSPVGCGVFSNGSIYWLMRDDTNSRILKIDPENVGNNDILDLPLDKASISLASLDSLNENLYLVCYHTDKISFWLREEDRFWKNLISLSIFHPRNCPRYCKMLHMDNDQLLLKVGAKLQWWDRHNTGMLKVSIPAVQYIRDGIGYYQSLIPPPVCPSLKQYAPLLEADDGEH